MDTDLGLWKTPFEVMLPISITQEPGDDASIFDIPDLEPISFEQALNKNLFQLSVEAGYQRYDEWKFRVGDEVAERLQAEIIGRLEAWRKSCRNRPATDEIGVCIAWRVGLEWSARIICSLVTEVEIRRSGDVEYEEAFRKGNLPWQCLNTCT